MTLVGEADRKLLKAAIKHSAGADQVRHRTVPPEIVAKYVKKLELLKPEVTGVMQDEKEEKHVRLFRLDCLPCIDVRELTFVSHSFAKRRWSFKRARI